LRGRRKEKGMKEQKDDMPVEKGEVHGECLRTTKRGDVRIDVSAPLYPSHYNIPSLAPKYIKV